MGEMNATHCDAMKALQKIWKIKSWSMTCRHCKRWLAINRDGCLVEHVEGCINNHDQHPWARLRGILNDQMPPPVEVPA